MKIYTRGGDAGTTGLFGGKRVPKGIARLHAYGSIDELNAILGRVRTMKDLPATINAEIATLQSLLFVVGSDLATPMESVLTVPRITAEHTQLIEEWIDACDAKLAPLVNFILPGGSSAAADLHLARTVCRRAERWISTVSMQENINLDALAFVNRVSDYLFVCARACNAAAGIDDVTVEPRKEASAKNSAAEKRRKVRGAGVR